MPSDTNTNNSVQLINLSLLTELRRISVVIDALLNACDDHTFGLWEGTPRFINRFWLNATFTLDGARSLLHTVSNGHVTKGLIDRYKSGVIDTETFLTELGDIFYFIDRNDNHCEILKQAWNTLVGIDEKHVQYFKALLEKAGKGEKIYLVSNTNELHMQLLLDTLKKHGIHHQITQAGITLGGCENLLIVPSYMAGTYKTPNQTSTTSLIGKIIDKEKAANPDVRITIVSQFEPDRIYCRENGCIVYGELCPELPLNNKAYKTVVANFLDELSPPVESSAAPSALTPTLTPT